MKKIFVYIGSNNKNSKTMKVFNEIRNNVEVYLGVEECEYTIFQAYNLNLKTCIGCSVCFLKGSCTLENKEQNYKEMLSAMSEADIIILGTPTYLHHISSEMKNFLDRIAYLTHVMPFIGKKCVLLVSADSNGSGFAMDYMKKIATFLGLNVETTGHFLEIDGKKSWELARVSNDLINMIKENSIEINVEIDQQYQSYKRIYSRTDYSGFEKDYWIENGYLEYETAYQLGRAKYHK
ncbi:flavodoxin family protein [Listeria monocytogenes]|nr:flavodoxin family protein [Listeria monocytogenes]